MSVPQEEPPSHRSLNRVRTFNKRILNPFTLRFAGRRFSPHGIVRHVGRKSHDSYDTPVVVGTRNGQFVIPLPYGVNADWCQNVLAAEGCTLVWQRNAYRAESPELIDSTVASEAFFAAQNWILDTVGVEQYLQLKRSEESPEEYREVAREYPAEPALVTILALILLVIVLRRLPVRRK